MLAPAPVGDQSRGIVALATRQDLRSMTERTNAVTPNGKTVASQPNAQDPGHLSRLGAQCYLFGAPGRAACAEAGTWPPSC